MKVLIVAGIFGSTPEFRARALQQSGETLLFEELRAQGVDVEARAPGYIDSWADFDVVHLNHLTNSCVRLLAPFRRAAAPQVVFTRHSTKRIPWHRRLVLAAAYRKASRVIVMSQPEGDLMPPSIDRSKVAVIANGVDEARFPASRRQAPGPGESWQLLVVGQLIEFKRVYLAIEAVRQLTDAGWPVHLTIAYHRDTLLPELKALAGTLDVTDKVTFLGPRTRDELGDDMASSHFLLHPSRTEAQPTVVTEAAMSGLPVLCFRTGGVAVQVPEGWELPEIDDVSRLTELFTERASDYEAIAEQWLDHAEVARRRFSISGMAAQHLELYKRAAENRG